MKGCLRLNTKRLVLLAMYTTISLTIFMIEAALPGIAPIPGIKLGLANIITLFVLVTMSAKDATLVLFVRIIMAALFAGQFVSLIYSICGGFLCLITMSFINRILCNKYVFVTSICGAVAHNIGQICAAYFVLKLYGIWVYVPYLIISGIVTGLITGLICHFILQKLPRKV